MGENYSSVQKLSLAGMFLAGILVLVGGFSPYWIVSDPQGDFGIVGNIVKGAVNSIIKGYMGLYVVCVESSLLNEGGCEVIDMEDGNGWFHSCRIAAAVCILVGCISGICALCLACCRCCSRFIALGIIEFVGGVCGAFAVGVYAKNTEAFTTTYSGFGFSSYGWGFYIFAAGVGLMCLVSFAACFAAPENPIRGMIMSGAPASVVVQTSSQMSSNPYFNLQPPQQQMGNFASNGY